MLSYLFKILVLTSCLVGVNILAFAQTEDSVTVENEEEYLMDTTGVDQDSTAIEEDPWPLNKHGEPKGSERFVLSGIRFGTDMRPLFQSMIDKNMSAYTLYTDLMIRNEFFLTAEYGQMDRTRENTDSGYFKYRSNGSFYRFGIEYNVMKRASIADALSFGFKYANSTFDQSADYYSTGNGYWEEGATLKHLTEKNVNVDWWELTVSLKITLIQNLSADFGFAYTIKRKFPHTVIEKNDIPGWYFNKDGRSRLNFQYRLLYRIPLWPMYTQPREKKKN